MEDVTMMSFLDFLKEIGTKLKYYIDSLCLKNSLQNDI